MKKSDQLKQTRAEKVTAQGLLISTAETANRDFTAEEQTQFDALENEIRSLDTNIASAVAVETAKERAAKNAGTRLDDGAQHNTRKRSFSIHRAILAQLGEVELDSEESREIEENRTAAIASGISPEGTVFRLPSRSDKSRAAQTVTGDSGTYGGETVATDVMAPIDFLRPDPLVSRNGATYLRNCVGDLKFSKNEGGIVATWEGETDETASTANVYASLGLSPKRLSVTVPISLQNLRQSSFDMEMYTINEINLALENKIDSTVVNGPGTGGSPAGILVTSGVNTVSTGTNGSAPTWDMVVDAETAVFVENANSGKLNYLINPKTRGTFKKTKHEAGDFNYLMTPQNEINGYGVLTSNHVPSNLTKGSGTGLSALVFGDLTQILIAQWGLMDFTVDPYTRKKEGLIEVTVNLYVDLAIKQPKAFTKIVGLITA